MQYTGKKIVLVPISEKYREDIFAASTPTLVRFLSWSVPKDISETDAFIIRSLKEAQEGKKFCFVALDKETEQFVGLCDIHDMATEPKIGLWVSESLHRKGYGKDMIQTLLVFAKDVLRLPSIVYKAHLDNIESQKLCESLGGVYIGTSTEKHKTESREMPVKDYLITL